MNQITTDYSTKFVQPEKGALYDVHRPPYSFKILKRLFKELGISAQAVTDKVIVDAGTGTGVFLEQLSGPATVFALEPSAPMRAIAEEHLNIRQASIKDQVVNGEMDHGEFDLYKRNLLKSKVVEGTTDKIELADKSVDYIVCGTSAHWFKDRESGSVEKTLSEFNRVLKPGGKIAILFNFISPDNDFTKDLISLYKENFNVDWADHGLFQTKAVAERFIESGTMNTQKDKIIHNMDREKFLNWLGTTSGPARSEFTTEQKDLLNNLFDKHKVDKNGQEVIELPYETSAYIGDIKSISKKMSFV